MNRARILTLVAVVSICGAATVSPAREGEPARYVPTDAERARWTMSDLRTLGIALEAFRTDNGRYPTAATLEEAIAAIEPIYVRKAPASDAWGTPLRYIAVQGGAGYLIASAGSDARFEESSWTAEGEAASYDGDAVLKDGRLTRGWAYR